MRKWNPLQSVINGQRLQFTSIFTFYVCSVHLTGVTNNNRLSMYQIKNHKNKKFLCITVVTVSVRPADEMHWIFVWRLFAVRVTDRQDSEQFTRVIHGSYGGQWTQSEHFPGLVLIIVRRCVHGDFKSRIWTSDGNYQRKTKKCSEKWLKFPK